MYWSWIKCIMIYQISPGVIIYLGIYYITMVFILKLLNHYYLLIFEFGGNPRFVFYTIM